MQKKIATCGFSILNLCGTLGIACKEKQRAKKMIYLKTEKITLLLPAYLLLHLQKLQE